MFDALFTCRCSGRNAITLQTLTNLLDKCKSMIKLKQIHALLFTLGLSQDDPFVPTILSFSASSNSSANIDYAYRVLLGLSNPTTFDWNTVLRGYSSSKNPNRSISVFVQMLQLGVLPDHLTYPFLLKASARLLNRQLGMSIHAFVAKTGYESDRFVSNSLIHVYGSCGDVEYARKVFEGIPVKNLVSWNSMVDGYSKCGKMDIAHRFFDAMSERDVVSWSSLIDGYVKCGDYGNALAVFEEMQISGAKANDVTVVSVLCACAHLGALEKGRKLHRYMIDNGLPLTLNLRTSLVDMYAKCGAIEEAFSVFRVVPVWHTDVLIWNAMIGGLATHGLINETLDLFTEMQIAGIRADEISYLCLLSACAHAGLTEKAWHFFECLDKHGMAPKIEHYACMVDAMARAGQVAEAFQFLCQMPIEPTAPMLGALLNGCMNHGKLVLAEIVGRKLVELEPYHDGRYVGLSNVYASFRRWDEARSTRKGMEKKGVKKSPGYSFVEISGAFHRFIAHDMLHPSTEKIYLMLHLIVGQMRLDLEHADQEFCVYDWKGT